MIFFQETWIRSKFKLIVQEFFDDDIDEFSLFYGSLYSILISFMTLILLVTLNAVRKTFIDNMDDIVLKHCFYFVSIYLP